jgi:hypothetical protein
VSEERRPEAQKDQIGVLRFRIVGQAQNCGWMALFQAMDEGQSVIGKKRPRHLAGYCTVPAIFQGPDVADVDSVTNEVL